MIFLLVCHNAHSSQFHPTFRSLSLRHPLTIALRLRAPPRHEMGPAVSRVCCRRGGGGDNVANSSRPPSFDAGSSASPPERRLCRRRRSAASPPPPPLRPPPPPPRPDPFARFAEAQAALPRPTLAEEARTLLASAKTGVSLRPPRPRAAPFGLGRPVCAPGLPARALSALSLAPCSAPPCRPLLPLGAHPGPRRDPRCSLTVLSPGFAGMEDGRVSLLASRKRLPDGGEEQNAARASYRAKHPDAFWSDFGDFSWWRLDSVGGEEGEGKANLPAARVVMGFGRAGSPDLGAARRRQPRPVSRFSGPVAGHMNADHGDAVLAVARSATGFGERVVRAAMGRVDRLGFEVELVLARRRGRGRSEGGGESGGGGEEGAAAEGGGAGVRGRRRERALAASASAPAWPSRSPRRTGRP